MDIATITKVAEKQGAAFVTQMRGQAKDAGEDAAKCLEYAAELALNLTTDLVTQRIDLELWKRGMGKIEVMTETTLAAITVREVRAATKAAIKTGIGIALKVLALL